MCFLRVPFKVSGAGNSSSGGSSESDAHTRDEGAVAVVSTAAGDLLVFEVAWAALKSAKSSSSSSSGSQNEDNESNQETKLPTTPELPLLR